MTKKGRQSNFRKQLTSVTPFSKFLAMFLFVILPIGAFFLGMTYQSTINSSNVEQVDQASALLVSDIFTEGWKNYTNDIAQVSIEYPSDWNVKETHERGNREVEDPNEINTAILKGKEGEVVIQWGPIGFGGGCDSAYKKTIKLKNEGKIICNGIDEQGTEFWNQISNGSQNKDTIVGVRAIAYKPTSTNSPTVEAILSTLEFN